MAKDCLKCSRPNNDRAPRCIYCGTMFPALPPEPKPTAAAGGEQPPAAEKPQPKAPESFLITISPDQTLHKAELKSFAALLRFDDYTAKHRLKQIAPWVARTLASAEEAQELARQLGDMGLDAYVLKQSGIEKLADRIQVVAVKTIGDDEMIFADANGHSVALRYPDVLLLVRGKIKEKTAQEALAEESPTPPVLRESGGAGGEGEDIEEEGFRGTLKRMRLRPRPVRKPGRFTMEIVDIYRKNATRALRLIESEFDYSGLGSDMTNSSLLNLNFLINRVKEKAPQAGVDTSFNILGYSFDETAGAVKGAAATDLLLELGGDKRKKKVMDNRAVFDDYSARVFLHYLRQSKSSQQSEKK